MKRLKYIVLTSVVLASIMFTGCTKRDYKENTKEIKELNVLREYIHNDVSTKIYKYKNKKDNTIDYYALITNNSKDDISISATLNTLVDNKKSDDEKKLPNINIYEIPCLKAGSTALHKYSTPNNNIYNTYDVEYTKSEKSDKTNLIKRNGYTTNHQDKTIASSYIADDKSIINLGCSSICINSKGEIYDYKEDDFTMLLHGEETQQINYDPDNDCTIYAFVNYAYR